jgi:hypothetical protein
VVAPLRRELVGVLSSPTSAGNAGSATFIGVTDSRLTELAGVMVTFRTGAREISISRSAPVREYVGVRVTDHPPARCATNTRAQTNPSRRCIPSCGPPAPVVSAAH